MGICQSSKDNLGNEFHFYVRKEIMQLLDALRYPFLASRFKLIRNSLIRVFIFVLITATNSDGKFQYKVQNLFVTLLDLITATATTFHQGRPECKR